MAEDQIRYDILAQEALRGVVKKVLTEVGKTGLPGEHHFFISFDTHASGVRISQRLLDQYEDEMTIVLQNQYWDLKVSETGFEVGLSFDGISEMLTIPYSAIKGFFDPSVQFGLQFEVASEEDDAEAPNEASITNLADKEPSPLSSNDADKSGGKQAKASKSKASKSGASKPSKAKADKSASADKTADTGDGDGENAGEKVVSLDAFRKKP